MGQSVGGQATNAATNAQNQANSAYGAAMPIYQRLAQGNTGYTPQQVQSMTNASGQSIAGNLASAQGQAQLAAARNNSQGGYAAALDDISRNAMATQSANVMNVQNQNAQIMQQNRDTGLQGLSGLYGTGSQAGSSYLNIANNADQNNIWTRILMQSMAGASQAAAGGAFGKL